MRQDAPSPLLGSIWGSTGIQVPPLHFSMGGHPGLLSPGRPIWARLGQQKLKKGGSGEAEPPPARAAQPAQARHLKKGWVWGGEAPLQRASRPERGPSGPKWGRLAKEEHGSDHRIGTIKTTFLMGSAPIKRTAPGGGMGGSLKATIRTVLSKAL